MIWRPSPCCFLSALVVRMVVPCLAWKDPFCFEWSGRDNPWPFSFQSQFSDLRFFWMLRSHCPEDSQQENRDDDRGSTDMAAVRSEYPSGSDTYEPWRGWRSHFLSQSDCQVHKFLWKDCKNILSGHRICSGWADDWLISWSWMRLLYSLVICHGQCKPSSVRSRRDHFLLKAGFGNKTWKNFLLNTKK